MVQIITSEHFERKVCIECFHKKRLRTCEVTESRPLTWGLQKSKGLPLTKGLLIILDNSKVFYTRYSSHFPYIWESITDWFSAILERQVTWVHWYPSWQNRKDEKYIIERLLDNQFINQLVRVEDNLMCWSVIWRYSSSLSIV